MTSTTDIKSALSSILDDKGKLHSASETFDDLPFSIIDDCLDQLGVEAAKASEDQWCTALVNAASGLSGIGPTQSKAITLYETVLCIDPSHREAIFALGIVYSDHGKTEELIRLYRQRISATEDSGEKATLHLYIAETIKNVFNDMELAFEEVLTAARLDPQNLRILDQLETLGRQCERDEEVTVILGEFLLHATDPHIRAGLALRLAELCLSSFDQPERALAYYKSALFEAGGDPNALKEIKDVFRQTDQFIHLSKFLDKSTKDRRTSPSRNRIQRELVNSAQEDEQHSTLALNTLLQAIAESPNDRRIITEMSELSKTTSDFQIFASALELVVHKSRNPLLIHFAQRKLGQIYTEELNAPEKAISIYKSIIEQHPNLIEALHSLGALYRKYRSADDSLQVYQRILDIKPNDTQALRVFQNLVRNNERKRSKPIQEQIKNAPSSS